MSSPYKLTENINQFIIAQKKLNPKISCRNLIPLIREHFQITLSKSLINEVVKQNKLSSPIGRRKEKAAIVVEEAVTSPKIIKKEGFIENGGCFFLKAAEIKTSLTVNFSDGFLSYFTDFACKDLRELIEASVFMPLFKDKKDLWFFMGKELCLDSLKRYGQRLNQVPLVELQNIAAKLGIRHNFNEINELYKICLLYLNSVVQEKFYPPAYQFLDLSAMQERFYSLWAKVKREEQLLEIQLFYPKASPWLNDIVWKEDLWYAADKVNDNRIFTPEKELLWINPKPEVLP